MNSLFGDSEPVAAAPDPTRPLAARLRPQTLDDIIGHEEIIGPQHALRRAIEEDVLPSLIVWGPPGTGKTTLAEVIARATKANFIRVSAVSSGVADLRRAVEEAKKLRRTGRRTVLFIDEIHRFNRAQQDAILPYVEDGTIALIGATTENPSFEVNAALLSRARVVVLQALGDAAIERILRRALDHPDGLAGLKLQLEPEALAQLVNVANGDARSALNTLEFAAFHARDRASAAIDAQDVESAFARRIVSYDKVGDVHYDTVSALIKSIRGSDPDAAIYWLARMIEGGEDPLFIVRRLVILASEDIGLADSQALPLAVAAQQAVHFVGMPEGYYALSHAVLYLACAPKGNSVGRAYGAALHDVRSTRNEPVPLHLRNAPTGLMRELGYGAGYRYAHDEIEARQATTLPPTQSPHAFRPDNLRGHRYLEPGTQGAERVLAEWVERRYREEP